MDEFNFEILAEYSLDTYDTSSTSYSCDNDLREG